MPEVPPDFEPIEHERGHSSPRDQLEELSEQVEIQDAQQEVLRRPINHQSREVSSRELPDYEIGKSRMQIELADLRELAKAEGVSREHVEISVQAQTVILIIWTHLETELQEFVNLEKQYDDPFPGLNDAVASQFGAEYFAKMGMEQDASKELRKVVEFVSAMDDNPDVPQCCE